MTKKKLTLLLILVITCSSCKKNSTGNPDSEDYYIKAKLNGQEIRYNAQPTGRVEGSKLSGVASNVTTSNFPSFSFDIEASAPIQADTTYKEALTTLIFRYSPSGTETFHSQMGNEMDFIIRVTEINNQQFKGTFSGTIRKASDVTVILQVTEGFFVLKR